MPICIFSEGNRTKNKHGWTRWPCQRLELSQSPPLNILFFHHPLQIFRRSQFPRLLFNLIVMNWNAVVTQISAGQNERKGETRVQGSRGQALKTRIPSDSATLGVDLCCLRMGHIKNNLNKWRSDKCSKNKALSNCVGEIKTSTDF